MDGNGTSESRASDQRSVEQLMLAGLGWLSLTAEAADEIAEDIARRLGVEPAKMREGGPGYLRQLAQGSEKLGSIPSEASERAHGRLGLVRREEADDLALRLAQLEHRVRLLEKPEA